MNMKSANFLILLHIIYQVSRVQSEEYTERPKLCPGNACPIPDQPILHQEFGYAPIYPTPKNRNNPVLQNLFPDDFSDNEPQIVSRQGWKARPMILRELENLKLPVDRVIISHTATEFCPTQEICSLRAQTIQKYHMDSLGYADIAYNFLIGGDGRVYEGRGWGIVGAHTKGFNADSVGVSFIGTFNSSSPTTSQLEAAQMLFEKGVELGKLIPEYRVNGARQFQDTTSPGDILYNIIQKWPNWSSVEKNPAK